MTREADLDLSSAPIFRLSTSISGADERDSHGESGLGLR